MRTKLVIALVTVGCIGTAQAAEKIRYEEIPARLAPFGSLIESYGAKVTTLDGATHKGRELRLSPEQVELGEEGVFSQTIPKEQIVRLEIRRGRQALDFTFYCLWFALSPVAGCVGGDVDACVAAPFFLPVIGFAAATAPFMLAADGIELLIPPKVYEIVH
jgi:hypothetical protein